MKNKIVLVPFPFDDLSTQKVRPAVCLTDEIQPYGHIVLTFITSQVSQEPSPTDLVIDEKDADFGQTGLKISSMIRLHRLMTFNKTFIKRELGELSDNNQAGVKKCLRNLFEL